MSKQPPPAPTASEVGPCLTVIQIVGRPAPPGHPRYYLIFIIGTASSQVENTISTLFLTYSGRRTTSRCPSFGFHLYMLSFDQSEDLRQNTGVIQFAQLKKHSV